MARIAGVNLPGKKRIEAGLLAIAGVGATTAKKLCVTAKINPDTRVESLTEDEQGRLRTALEGIATEGDLRRQVTGNIKLLQDIGAYRGVRHKKRLPVRGQRTRCNARTRKGKVRLAVAGKKMPTK